METTVHLSKTLLELTDYSIGFQFVLDNLGDSLSKQGLL